MTHDELRRIVANDDDPQSVDGAHGKPGATLFKNWSSASQEGPTVTSETPVSEISNPDEHRD